MGADVDGVAYASRLANFGCNPSLGRDRLNMNSCGARPTILELGQLVADGLIPRPKKQSAPGLDNFYGIESPGLTAGLTIAERVARVID